MSKYGRELRQNGFVGFSLADTLTLQHFDIVEYYPYTSMVGNRIVEQTYNRTTPFDGFLNDLWQDIENELREKHKITTENKCAVRLVSKENNIGTSFNGSLFIGLKDGIISVGLSLWQPWDFTKEHNKKLC